MSDSESFVDPVFLARFGLSRVNVLDYFLHPLNPFRTKANTSNEVLMMQGIGVGFFMQGGYNEPMSPMQAELEYARALSQNNGEQYELLPPAASATDNLAALYGQPSNLYTIRHVLRTNPTNVKVLGIYYVVEGVIYKSPSVRALMKANVARTLDGLQGACQQLSVCARFQPSTGYTWHFEAGDDQEDDLDPVALQAMTKRQRHRKTLDHRRPGERTAAEEEGIRSSEAMDRILVRLSQSSIVTGKNIGS